MRRKKVRFGTHIHKVTSPRCIAPLHMQVEHCRQVHPAVDNGGGGGEKGGARRRRRRRRRRKSRNQKEKEEKEKELEIEEKDEKKKKPMATKEEENEWLKILKENDLRRRRTT